MWVGDNALVGNECGAIRPAVSREFNQPDNLPSAIGTLKVNSAPGADRFQHWHQRPSVLGDRISHAWWHGVLLMPDEDSIPNEVLEMSDQHSLSDFGNAPTQFTGAQRAIRKPPKNRPFPAPVDDGQHGIDRAGRYLLLRYGHLRPTLALTSLSVQLYESV